MKYFTGTTQAEIKKEYYRLAMKYHPDHGGSDEIMKEINAEYLTALKACDGKGETYTDNAGHERDSIYRFSEEVESEIINKIDELLRLKKQLNNLKILLIGEWLWIDGATKEQKDFLNKNGAGCLWSPSKEMWYWRPTARKSSRRYRGNGDLLGMAIKYGYSEVKDRVERKTIN